MPSDTLIKEKGMRALTRDLGIVDAEKFIVLVRRDAFDYTEWQRDLYKDVPLDEFLRAAREYSERLGPDDA